MENTTQVSAQDEFKLVSPPDQLAEGFVQAVLDDMAQPQEKRPLQCVTVKMPLPAYLRLKRASHRWNMTYTDVINFCTERVVPVLESPSGEVAQQLEKFRAEAEDRKALRAARRR